MKNIILLMLVVLFCNFANAQGLGNLLGGNKDGGKTMDDSSDDEA